MKTLSRADDHADSIDDDEISSCSSYGQENSRSHSEPESDFSGMDEDSSDSDFQPENQGKSEGSDDELELPEVHDTNIAAPKQEQNLKKKLQRDPKPGDSWRQHSAKITRLIRQAECNGKISYLGPAVGWDEEKLHQYLRSVDERIPDAANIPGEFSNSL
jgi:hypothetical protein